MVIFCMSVLSSIYIFYLTEFFHPHFFKSSNLESLQNKFQHLSPNSSAKKSQKNNNSIMSWILIRIKTFQLDRLWNPLIGWADHRYSGSGWLITLLIGNSKGFAFIIFVFSCVNIGFFLKLEPLIGWECQASPAVKKWYIYIYNWYSNKLA